MLLDLQTAFGAGTDTTFAPCACCSPAGTGCCLFGSPYNLVAGPHLPFIFLTLDLPCFGPPVVLNAAYFDSGFSFDFGYFMRYRAALGTCNNCTHAWVMLYCQEMSPFGFRPAQVRVYLAPETGGFTSPTTANCGHGYNCPDLAPSDYHLHRVEGYNRWNDPRPPRCNPLHASGNMLSISSHYWLDKLCCLGGPNAQNPVVAGTFEVTE